MVLALNRLDLIIPLTLVNMLVYKKVLAYIMP